CARGDYDAMDYW
nr:immunoglobulin heavy chain junction region [Mus musculus]MBK4195073.1 immunoglobulin heavy chain junction region [Mus musculus]